MKHLHVKRLVMLSAIATLVALAMMVLAIVAPKPIVLVLAMSLGQGIGILSLALYLLAIGLDLQTAGGAYAELPDEAEAAPAVEERWGHLRGRVQAGLALLSIYSTASLLNSTRSCSAWVSSKAASAAHIGIVPTFQGYSAAEI